MGIPTLIATGTADTASDSVIQFTSGITSAYDEYMFVCTDINPGTDNATLGFQVNSTNDAGGDYDTSLITSTFFKAHHYESDAEVSLAYHTGNDQAQAAGFQILAYDVGSDADQCTAGVMNLFSPSSTTYVKHFYARMNETYFIDISTDCFIAGYINDTTAIDEIRFKMSSGAFDGVIQMYGIA